VRKPTRESGRLPPLSLLILIVEFEKTALWSHVAGRVEKTWFTKALPLEEGCVVGQGQGAESSQRAGMPKCT